MFVPFSFRNPGRLPSGAIANLKAIFPGKNPTVLNDINTWNSR
jgi:hypothetical protein